MEIIEIHSKIHNYSVKIDNNLEELLLSSLNKNEKFVFVVDSKLINKYHSFLAKNFKNSLFFNVEAGENAKSIQTYTEVISFLTENDITKNDTIVAFGGGTICDLVGYVASTFKRGMNYINIPTTTLAMVDASIGGKNGINFDTIKNLIGNIYPPKQVLIGLNVLETLPKEHFNNGLFESIKMGLIGDEKLFKYFENDYKSHIFDIVLDSINVKKRFVEEDEEDVGIRKILNFGHTFGHALESTSKFNLLHGEAIANGMLIALYGQPLFEKLKNILVKMDCPIIKKLEINSVIQYIKNDKKACKSGISFIKIKNICEPEILNLSIEEIERMAKNYGI